MTEASRATLVLQVFSVVLIAILAALFVVTMQRYENLKNSASEGALWAVTQFDRETRKLSREIGITLRQPVIDIEAMERVSTKYDIVYSRLNLLEIGTFDRPFEAYAPSEVLIKEIRTELFSLVGIFDRMSAGEVLSREDLSDVYVSIGSVLDRSERLVASEIAVQANVESDDRAALVKPQLTSAAIAATLLVSILALVVLLRRQLSSVKAAKTEVEMVAADLRNQVDQAVGDVRSREEEIIERLSTAAGHKDGETELHTRRVAAYSEAVALCYGFDKAASHDIRLASLMHDIGKVGIPDVILQKAGRLTDSEFDVMKTHTVVGDEILKESSAPLLQLASVIARSHHERWDGAGYPDGLAGEDIPLAGRIVALADNFDALTSARVYKSAWTVDNALSHISTNAGQQFDPACVRAFEAALPKILEIRNALMEPVALKVSASGM